MYKQSQTQPTVLYLRVDLGGQQLTAGGSVAHTLGVLKGFISNGWSVVCASSAMHGPLSSIDTISFYPLSMPSCLRFLRWKLNCLLSNIFFTWRIIRVCSSYRITCVYQRHGPFCVVGTLIAWWLKVPLILEYNGSEVWMARHWDVRARMPLQSLFSFGWLLRFFEHRALRTANQIVVVSQASCTQLQQAGIAAANIIVRPNGVDTQQFDSATRVDDRVRIRHQYGYDHRFVFGFIGTFSPWHGIDQLAQMIPQVVARHPQASFLLVGDGQLKSWLQDSLTVHGITTEQVIFTGKVPAHTAPAYLAACDAFLLPTQPNADGTQFFGSPIKLFEYMSMAKPIIASEIAQVADILSGIGILVAPDNIQGFIDAAVELITKPTHERHMLGARARDYVIAHGTWHEQVKAIIATTQHESIV